MRVHARACACMRVRRRNDMVYLLVSLAARSAACSVAWPVMAWPGMAWPGMAWPVMGVASGVVSDLEVHVAFVEDLAKLFVDLVARDALQPRHHRPFLTERG